ncbi:RNA-directed DNA polymerase, eukaryota, reverse transcriptase zinc-binding domain protein [Tanacetum coccineum]
MITSSLEVENEDFINWRSLWGSFVRWNLSEVDSSMGIFYGMATSVWVNWNKVLAAKVKGGLGVSSLYALNGALLFKWIWRFTTHKSSLWARVITVIHGIEGNIGSHSKKFRYKSLWRDIVSGMEDIKKQGADLRSFIHKKIGNGSDTNFWEDSWNDPRSGAGPSQLGYFTGHSRSCGLRLPEVSSQSRWIKEVPIKVNVLSWKVRLDSLPTRLNISRRGIDIPSILCPICDREVESMSHLFFKCHVATDIFKKICRWWNVDFVDIKSYDDWFSWLLNLNLRGWEFRDLARTIPQGVELFSLESCGAG